MYQAIIAPLTNVRKHLNADRVQLATVAGFQIVVGLDTKEGELGVFFPSDGALSREMLLENRLYQTHPETGEKMGGYFDKNGRVRIQKFRGEKSEGFWMPLSSLSWTGIDPSVLTPNYTFTDLNGKIVCFKYIPSASKRIGNAPKPKGIFSALKKRLQREKKFPLFKEHYETKQLRYWADKIPEGSILYISEKCHGTSGRTSFTRARKELNLFKLIWNKTIGSFGPKFERHEYTYVTGTRRTVLDHEGRSFVDPFHGGNYREKTHIMFKNLGLKKGETFYYEIVGFTDQGASIMPSHSTDKEPKVKKKYGDKIVYSYGCDPANPLRQNRVLVYRITQTNEDGDIYELPWNQIVKRCSELGLETVPLLQSRWHNDFDNLLMETCETLSQGCSELDPRHIKEGVCLRVENGQGTEVYKYKSFLFCLFEDIAKNKDDYEDIEDIL